MRIHPAIADHFPSGRSGLKIEAPAKLNLYLEILGKRPDGYHELETLLCPISLLDEVVVEPRSDAELQLSLEVLDLSNEASAAEDPAWKIPVDENNLVFRAARAVQEQLGSGQGWQIRLRKRIPAMAGLGGGSSDAAAVVVACLLLMESWNRELAVQICGQLGSDVPFFLGDENGIGMGWATGRGEICESLPFRPALEFLVLHPPAGCSTVDVYRNFRLGSELRNGQKIIAACKSGQAQKIGIELFNALQSAASSSSMWVGRQLEWLTERGFRFALMTGSGSSCFALLDTTTQIATECQADISHLRSLASQSGIGRVYRASAWYADSIEQQLRKLSC